MSESSRQTSWLLSMSGMVFVVLALQPC